jgi:hypothetical protein
MNRHAPRFSGSSCTQAISVAPGYFARIERISFSGNGYNCSTRTIATSVRLFFRRASSSVKYTFPEHEQHAPHALRVRLAGSSSTTWKLRW